MKFNMGIRKVFIIALAAVVILLDYAALDDITTGKQPYFYFEYLAIIASLPIMRFIIHEWRKN